MVYILLYYSRRYYIIILTPNGNSQSQFDTSLPFDSSSSGQLHVSLPFDSSCSCQFGIVYSSTVPVLSSSAPATVRTVPVRPSSMPATVLTVQFFAVRSVKLLNCNSSTVRTGTGGHSRPRPWQCPTCAPAPGGAPLLHHFTPGYSYSYYCSYERPPGTVTM